MRKVSVRPVTSQKCNLFEDQVSATSSLTSEMVSTGEGNAKIIHVLSNFKKLIVLYFCFRNIRPENDYYCSTQHVSQNFRLIEYFCLEIFVGHFSGCPVYTPL